MIYRVIIVTLLLVNCVNSDVLCWSKEAFKEHIESPDGPALKGELLEDKKLSEKELKQKFEEECKKYSSYTYDYQKSYSLKEEEKKKLQQKRSASLKAIYELTPQLYALCGEDCVRRLQCVEADYEEHYFEHTFMLKKYLPARYEEKKKDLHYTKLIEDLCVRPELHSLAQGDEELSLEALLARRVFSKESKVDWCEAAVFFQYGSEYHAQYENEIVELLPVMMATEPYSYRTIEILLHSSLPSLQKQALSVLLEGMQGDDYVATKVCDDIVEFLSKNKNVEYLNEAFDTFNKTDNAYGVFKLGLTIAQERKDRSYSYAQIASYFNVSLASDDTTFNPKSFLYRVIERAKAVSAEKTLCTLMNGRTVLETILSPSFYNEIDEEIVLNSTLPLKMRAKAFAFLLNRINSSRVKHQKAESLLMNLEEGVLKEYCACIAALFLNPPSFEEHAFLRKLSELQKNNPGLYLSHEGYGVSIKGIEKLENCYWNTLYVDQKQHHIIGSHLRHLHVSEGMVFGYLSDSYGAYFYAFDEKTGDALWRTKCNSLSRGDTYLSWGRETHNPPFVCHQDRIYLAEKGFVSILDKKTGRLMEKIDISSSDAVVYLAVNSQNILSIVTNPSANKQSFGSILGEATLMRINLNTAEKTISSKIMEAGKTRGLSEFFNVGDKIGRYYLPTRSLYLYNDECAEEIVSQPLIASEESFHTDLSYAVCDSYLLYQFRNKDNNYLVCYDVTTNQEIWKQELNDIVLSQMQISPQGDTLYSLTDAHLRAFNFSSEGITQRWSISLKQDRFTPLIDQIKVSQNGEVIYAIDGNYGDLYTIGAQTGEMKSLDKFKLARVTLIQDINDQDELFLQGISF